MWREVSGSRRGGDQCTVSEYEVPRVVSAGLRPPTGACGSPRPAARGLLCAPLGSGGRKFVPDAPSPRLPRRAHGWERWPPCDCGVYSHVAVSAGECRRAMVSARRASARRDAKDRCRAPLTPGGPCSEQITELDVALQSGIDIGDSLVQGRVEIYSCEHSTLSRPARSAHGLLRAELPIRGSQHAALCAVGGCLPVEGSAAGNEDLRASVLDRIYLSRQARAKREEACKLLGQRLEGHHDRPP